MFEGLWKKIGPTESGETYGERSAWGASSMVKKLEKSNREIFLKSIPKKGKQTVPRPF